MKKRKIAFVAGCFDSTPDNLPHEGHKFLLGEMRKLVGKEGYVVVGLNEDEYILDYKKRQPLSNWDQRFVAIANTRLVNDIQKFYCNPIDLIMYYKPDYIVCGSDYQPANIIGFEESKQWGGQVVIIPRLPNISTSAIVKNIENSRSMTVEEQETSDKFIKKQFVT
jgi:D-beta-D-heptose 7-phosphate kinase/D-beta-D-heptose 1-phosphate adenosyltransferase